MGALRWIVALRDAAGVQIRGAGGGLPGEDMAAGTYCARSLGMARTHATRPRMRGLVEFIQSHASGQGRAHHL